MCHAVFTNAGKLLRNYNYLLIYLCYKFMESYSESILAGVVKRILVSLLLVFVLPVLAYAQKSVKGVITDSNGEPLTGVTVIVKGTNRGVSTDIDGNFNILANNGDVLKISYVGMQNVEVKVGAKANYNIKMRESDKTLDEVVVVGYGKQKKSSLTSAVSAIKGDELLTTPSTNITSVLGGRLPGISSVQTSGEPGLDDASLRIRGSIYTVHYIVDGVPRDINDIDPNDIASVSVLKDASAAAVYGLQSGGGVVIVTTKQGRVGKPQITYTGSIGASVNANFPKFMNGPQFAYYYNMGDMMDQLANGTITDRSQYSPKFTQENIAAMTNGDPTDGWDNVDYIGKVFGTGINTRHNVTVSGGNETSKYFASIGYLDQKGNIDSFSYRRYTARMNLDSKINKYWTFNMGLSGEVGNRHTPGFASGGSDNGDSESGFLSIAHQAIVMHPYLPETMDGLYTATPIRNTGLPHSPLAAIYQSGYQKTNGHSIQSNLSLQFDFPWVKGLSAKVTGSYDYSTSHNKNMNIPYYVQMINLGTMTYSKTIDPRGNTDIRMGEGTAESKQLLGQYQLNYINSFNKNNIDVLALCEVNDSKYSTLAAYAKGLSVTDLDGLSFGQADGNPSSYNTHSRTVGYVFRVKYDYDQTYLAEVSGRYDGSYLFNGNVSGKRWVLFPSGSVAWRITKEPFMQDLTFLNDMKIRASVGVVGNSGVDAYHYLDTYGYSGLQNIGGTLQNAIYSTVIGNPNLTWEKVISYNAGFDFTMWHGLLGADFDVFYNYTKDILTGMGADYPPSMGGYYTTTANYNKVDAKGFDLSLTHRNKFMLAGIPFNYSITGNISYAKNRYLRYPDSPNTSNGWKRTGTSVYAIECWIADGLYKSEEEITNSAWVGTRPNIGDIKYRDLDGDGVITWQDRTYVGKDNRPLWTYGFNLQGEWNGIDFNAQFTGGLNFDVSMTGTYYNGYDDNTIWTQTFKENANSPLWLVEKAYSIDNPNGTYPRITVGNLTHGGDNGLASTFWLKKGDYLRMKSLQIGYTFPARWMKVAGIDKLRVFVEGSNLFTIDSLPEGIDPESPEVNNGYYPQQKTFMGGLTLSF